MRENWNSNFDMGHSSEDDHFIGNCLINGLSVERRESIVLAGDAAVGRLSIMAIRILFWDAAAHVREGSGIGIFNAVMGESEHQEAQLTRKVDEAMLLLPRYNQVENRTTESIFADMLRYWSFGKRTIEKAKADSTHKHLLVTLALIVIGRPDGSQETASIFEYRPQLQLDHVVALFRNSPLEML